MASPAIIDIDELLKPISEERPVGENLRLNNTPASQYSTIKDARNAARAAERKNMFDDSNTEASEHWKKIITLAPQILTSEAKDLEIASWYTEALIRKSGFAGLRDGFTLLRQLVEQYWEAGLYPAADEDGIETRVAPISGLNGEGSDGVLLAPIRRTEITDDFVPGPFSLWQYKQAIDLSRMTDDNERGQQASKIGFSMEDIGNVVEQSSSDYFVNLRDDITICLTEYRALSELLITHCSHDAPATNKIIELLEETLNAVNHIAKHKYPVEEEAVSDDSPEEAHTSSTSSPAQKGPISSRDEAFRQLKSISDFFRGTEPHSPISYVLDKAVRWGDMPLDELMSELIPDRSSRATYSSLTGVKTDDN
ncbi:MAG: type VI secretion system protein TssA [Gammaproteobacteria bacterium]|nr:type VI secretion system protein TssA [Gammaproteobacteria bacterium]